MEYVHFIRPKGEEGPIHIAASPNPQKALQFLQVGNPNELELMGTVDARLYAESWWYDTLSPWNIRGGWYEPKAQVLCRVEDAIAGRLETPNRIDPLEDTEDLTESIPDRVPLNVLVQTRSRSELAKLKWAWPTVDPYPAVERRTKPRTNTLTLLRKLAHTTA